MTAADHPAASSRRRGTALASVVVAVVLAHAWITQGVLEHLHDMQAGQDQQIKRMEATLIADMRLSAPPVLAAPPVTTPPAPRLADLAVPAASAASAPPPPDVAPSQAETPSDPDMAASEPANDAALDTPDVAASRPFSDDPLAYAGTATPAAQSAASAPAFEWPLATRVTFKLEGHLRGPVHGDAMVEWVRQEQRYQVHVDATIGPRFAPIGSQRWTSEGIITPEGLQPERFESVNKLLIKRSTPKVITFEDKEVVLADGRRLAKTPGVQDPASHYIQMAYQFILDPEALRVGKTVSLPLARTRHQEVVIYDILGEELLDTPLGKVNTFRLRPRPLTDQKDDLLGELWIAPSLQYLPIRMLIRQGPSNYLDMRMDRAPQQASASASAASAPSPSPAPPAERRPAPLQQIPIPP